MTEESRASREHGLWEAWRASGKHPSALRPLVNSLAPLVHKTVNTYAAADVATPALLTQAENQLIQGLHSYDPTKGATLSTHLNWQMRGVGRFVEKHQNLARIPGSRIRHIGKVQSATKSLTESLGRAPTLSELARKSKVPKHQVEKLQREIRPVHILGMDLGSEGMTLSDLGTGGFSPDRERLELLYPDLTPMEQQVVDYSVGRAGKPVIESTGQLAGRLKVSPARISNIRASITKKLMNLHWIR